MSSVYEAIGRAVVGFIRVRYRNQLRIAAAAGLVAVAAATYLAASREVEEG